MFLNTLVVKCKSDTMPEEKKEAAGFKFKKIVVWQVLTILFAGLFIGVLIGKIPVIYPGMSGLGIQAISSEEAGNKVVDYINTNLIQSGSCSLVSVQDTGGLYKVVTSYQGQQIPVYVTKDGTLLFVSNPVDITKAPTSTQTQTQTITKSEKPTVELYVMSFCPYGIQAEQLMDPVFNLLGSKADFKIRFIATVGGSTVDSIQSLHGSAEAQEDLRQICIMKNYDAKTYWNYLQTFDANCPSLRDDATALGKCWKDAATKAGIDASSIETCSGTSDVINLLKADEALVSQYGITGSPTLLINGVQYGGGRSSASFQQGICSAFTTMPAECSQNVTSNSTASGSGSVSGGCS